MAGWHAGMQVRRQFAGIRGMQPGLKPGKQADRSAGRKASVQGCAAITHIGEGLPQLPKQRCDRQSKNCSFEVLNFRSVKL